MMAKRAAAERTLPALLATHAEVRPEAPFVIDERGTLTWAAAHELARRYSAGFADLGIARSDRVAIMLGNRREFLAAWFGLGCLGAIEVPVNPEASGDHLVHVLGTSGCRAIVIDASSLTRLDAVAERLPWIERLLVVGDGVSRRFPSLSFGEVQARHGGDIAKVSLGDPAAIMFTSGSTGPPKGALLTHGQHYMNGYQPSALFDISPRDVIYVCLPLHHNMAQGYGVCVSLVSGAAVRLAPRFDAASFWQDVRRHHATILSFVGAMLVLLAKREPSEDEEANPLRVGFGVPIPADLHEPFQKRFGLRLVHCYGSTEATIVAWNNRPDAKPGAAGRPLPDYDVRILDADDLPVPTGKVGEICVRPHEPFSMFAGYYGEPERTVEAWRNLWFHTGDRGWFDEDGDLWFSDRASDTVRHLGEFVSCHEVEQALVCHSDIQLAAAFGVPSELIDEELMVAVVPRLGARVDAATVRGWCADRLPPHFVPRFVEVLEELPMTPTGKIEKFKLRRRGVTAATDDARQREEELR